MDRLMFVPFVALLLACGDGTVAGVDTPLTNDDFADALNVDLAAMTRTQSGLYWQDLVVGSGDEAVSGATIEVQYDGWLTNGTLFDSSRDDATPFRFVVGARQVIRGWDEGVAGMLVGGTRKLVIPPNLAYGVAGRPGIPSNATLVFDVELIAVNP